MNATAWATSSTATVEKKTPTNEKGMQIKHGSSRMTSYPEVIPREGLPTSLEVGEVSRDGMFVVVVSAMDYPSAFITGPRKMVLSLDVATRRGSDK